MQGLNRLSVTNLASRDGGVGNAHSHVGPSGTPQVSVMHPPYDPAQGHRALRLSNQLRERFESIKVLAHTMKKTELCDVTHAMLSEWSNNLLKAVSECDEVVANLPTRIADMDAAALHAPAHASNGGGRRASMASKGSISPAMLSPKDPGFAFPPISLGGFNMGGAAAAFGGGGAGGIVSTMVPDSGSLSYTLQATAEPAAERMHNLALSIHLCLDAASRSINAERASICMPVRGVKEDLRSVCSVGFVNEDHQSYRPTHTSPESLCMQSGLMIVCSNGTNPPVELDMRSALAFFQDASDPVGNASTTSPAALNLQDTTDMSESMAKHGSRPVPRVAAAMMMRAAQHRPTPLNASATFQAALTMNAPSSVLATAAGKHGGGAGGMGPTIVTSLKSRYWSKIVCPLRLTNTSPILGVATFLNKDKGNNNFSTDDETIVFGAAAAIAVLLARCTDIELLSRCFEKNPSVPPFPAHLSTPVTVPGSRTQLVYRTKEPSGGKDIRILVADGKSERLDSHTALMAVSDYIQRMQQSWKDAVLLNAELRRTHEERTRVVTSLLVRARTSELRNTVLEKERIALIPEDDEHNAKHFRDYAQFKKHRHRLEELVNEDAREVTDQRRQEEQRLRERQSERQKKYSRVSSSVVGVAGGLPSHVNVLSRVATGGEFGSDDDDMDVYANSDAGSNGGTAAMRRVVAKAQQQQQRRQPDYRQDSQDDDDPGEDLVESPQASPTPSVSPAHSQRIDGGSHSNSGRATSEPFLKPPSSVTPTAAERRTSSEFHQPAENAAGGGSPAYASFEAPDHRTPHESSANDAVEGDAPELEGVLLREDVSLGQPAENMIVVPNVSVTPAHTATGRTSSQQQHNRRTSSGTTPQTQSRAGSVVVLSGQPTPSDSAISATTSEGGPPKRDRRLSRQAKELLFGKEQLPPALL